MTATRWRDHSWQIIHNGPQAPLVHMALDSVLVDEVGAGRRAPTLRIWEWAAAAVVIGRFQSLRNEVDAEAARRFNVQVVRRISGGGAMFVEPGNTITYSLYAPASLVEGMSFAQSYAFLDAWVLDALKSLGIEAWYQPLNDIASAGGKIGGAAQARRNGAVLHHVTMAYDIDADKLTRVLRIGREKLSDKGIASASKRVDPLRSQTGLPRGAIIARMVDTFRDEHGLVPGAVTIAEQSQAESLAYGRYASAEWLAQVP
jgi:lipoate-protein ligase A